jgi:hypothetical protein
MKAHGGYKSIDGGRVVNAHLEYALNPNVGWIGETATLPQAEVEVFDEATYSWKILAGTVPYTELEKAINQGSGAKFDLLEAKLENVRATMMSSVNSMLFGTASGQQPAGLTDAVPDDPTTGTYGGINRGTYTFWRSNTIDDGGSSFNALLSNMRITYNNCANGVSSQYPDVAVTTQTVFQGYEGLLTANERYIRDSQSDKGVTGFKSKALLFKDIPIYFDEDCGSARLYMLNLKAFKLAYPAGFWMKAFPPVDPANQLADTYKFMSVCVPIVTSSRRLGVIFSIA